MPGAGNCVEKITKSQSAGQGTDNSRSHFVSVKFSHSVLTDSLWPMDCSTPGLPVHHQLPELAQTHVHWVGNTIQPYYPLLSPSPPAFNLSQHQGLFQWVSSSHQVLELQLQHHSFQWIFRTDFLRLTGLIFMQSKGLLRIFSNSTVEKQQLFCAQLSLYSNSNIHTWLLEKP